MSLKNKFFSALTMAFAVFAFSTFVSAQDTTKTDSDNTQKQEKREWRKGKRDGMGKGFRRGGDRRGGFMRGFRDLNLTDGTIIPAADIVAAGLFQSNQFYPAQILTYTVTDYCSYDASTWGGNWIATETPGSVDPGKMTQDGVDPNKYVFNNWWGDGVDAYMIFSPSTNPGDQIVEVPKQTTSEGGEASGKGTYNQCLDEFTINAKYVIGGGTYEFIYSFARP